MKPRRQFRSQAARIILAQFSKMQSHERGTLLGKDIECLHRMRVASRRLRARIQDFEVLFGKRSYAWVQKRVRRITRQLGTARDLDVFEEFLVSLPGLARFKRPASALLKVVHEQQVSSRAELAELFLKEKRRGTAGEIKRYFSKYSQEPVSKSVLRAHMRSFARQVIHPRFIILEASRHKRFAGATGSVDLHQMRICAKKLRYSMEIFEIYYGKEFAQLILEVRKVQDAAGRVHDLEVYEQRIRMHAEKGIAKITSCAPILAYCKRQRAEAFAEFQKTWRAFWRLDLGSLLHRYWAGAASRIPG
jgi:CHAD domain-containing protein